MLGKIFAAAGNVKGLGVATSEPTVRPVGFKVGDRVVCTGTAFNRFEKGEVGTIRSVSLDGLQVHVHLDGHPAAIPIGQSCLAHADGVEWELAPAPDAPVKKRSQPLPAQLRSVKRGDEIEELMQEFFRKHDLNGNGVLEELELVKLNEKIQLLNADQDLGKDDKRSIREKYTTLFREKLDRHGEPVVYPIFREYILEVLDSTDADEVAQVSILEHWIAVADSARSAFLCSSLASETDAPFLQGLVLGTPRR